MASAGIRVLPELKEQFTTLQSGDLTGCKVQLKKNKFKLVSEFKATEAKALWDEARASAEEREPAWFLLRSLRPKEEDKWVFVFYCPSGSTVRNRMIYSSSVNDLKAGFGSAMFVRDHHVTDATELTHEEYVSTLTDWDPKELMTSEELERVEGEFQSAMSSGGGKKQVTVAMNMAATEGLEAAVAAVTSGPNTAIISINTKKEKLLLAGAEELDIDGLTSKMQEKPLFLVHNFKYTHDGKDKSKILFIYYCATDAKARVKMIFSSTKSRVVSLCEAQGLTEMRNFELSDPAEFTHDYVINDLHPPVIEKKVMAKPKAKGRGRRRLIGGKKFTPN